MHSKYEIFRIHFFPNLFILFLFLRGFYPLQMPKNIDNVETSYAMETHTHTHTLLFYPLHTHNTTKLIHIQNAPKPMSMGTIQGPWWSYHASISSMGVSTQHGRYNSSNLNIAVLEHAQSTMPMPILLCYYLDMDFKCIQMSNLLLCISFSYRRGCIPPTPLTFERAILDNYCNGESIVAHKYCATIFPLLFFDYFLVNIIMTVYLAMASTLH